MAISKRPTSKLKWVSDGDVAKQTEPSAGDKLQGWTSGQEPPFQTANWQLYIIWLWLNYFAGESEEYIVISSDADEGDYSSLQAYIADAPAAGDKVLIKEDQSFGSKLTIPDGIKIKMIKGIKLFTLTNLAEAVEFGDNVTIEEEFLIEFNNTGTLGSGVVLNGDNINAQALKIIMTSTGTLTAGIELKASKKGCKVNAVIKEDTGIVTRAFNDDANSEVSNAIQVRSY